MIEKTIYLKEMEDALSHETMQIQENLDLLPAFEEKIKELNELLSIVQKIISGIYDD